MASSDDYYLILGLGRDATAQEIKSAYRKLAVQYHPDRNPGDQDAEEKFKRAAEAYAVLSDPEKRSRYDHFGARGVTGGGFSGFDPSVFGDFSDILGDFFGFGDVFGSRRRGPGQPGADLRYELSLDLEQAAFGFEKELEIPRLERCDACSGRGTAGGSEPAVCQACRGQGQVRFTQGFFTVARTCPQCRGEGSVITEPCVDCRGQGRLQRRRKIEVKIPAGVDTGTRLRLAGEGEHGQRGGRTGDLYVDIVVTPHAFLHRDGPNTLSEQKLTYAQAVLGTSVEVETLHGSESLEIPSGTKHGREFRLRGKGIDRLNGRGRGDHLVVVTVVVPHPRDLSDEEVACLRQLAHLSGDSVKEEKGVLGRVRDLFG
ncbi:MAG: molecular chaperone DnaJ [Acidobacteriota bacterium]|nr:molecular chaperone DnaJ [Acidobacteriota bacterium]